RLDVTKVMDHALARGTMTIPRPMTARFSTGRPRRSVTDEPSNTGGSRGFTIELRLGGAGAEDPGRRRHPGHHRGLGHADQEGCGRADAEGAGAPPARRR